HCHDRLRADAGESLGRRLWLDDFAGGNVSRVRRRRRSRNVPSHLQDSWCGRDSTGRLEYSWGYEIDSQSRTALPEANLISRCDRCLFNAMVSHEDTVCAFCVFHQHLAAVETDLEVLG